MSCDEEFLFGMDRKVKTIIMQLPILHHDINGRIPDGGRFELRLADGAVNPYLLQAAILGKYLQWWHILRIVHNFGFRTSFSALYLSVQRVVSMAFGRICQYHRGVIGMAFFLLLIFL